MKKSGLLHRLTANINIPLLIFLVLFFNVKLVVKLLAIILIILYYKDFKFGLSWKKSRLPLFYALIIGVEIVKYILITRNYSFNYLLVFGLGIFQWTLSLLAMHFVKLAIEKSTPVIIHNTIRAFFVLNLGISIFFLSLLVFAPHLLSYWGHGADISINHPSAGDTILGITFDASTINATLNSMGLIYFLYKRDYLFSFICLLIIILCTSNVTFLIILGTLGLMFITVRSNKIRLATFLAGLLMVVLYFSISTANREYIRNFFVQLYILNKNSSVPTVADNDSSSTSSALAREKAGLPDTVYTFSNQSLKKSLENLLTTGAEKSDSFGVPELHLTDEDFNRKPGKLISFFQTYNFLKSSSKNFLFGAGIGRFSSKLAFRAAGVQNFGSYPQKFVSVSRELEKNHLRTFLFYFRKDASRHSVLNYPTSVYNQLLGEYGFIGALLFAVFYIGYFIKRYKSLTYGRYLIFALLVFFFMEYWFEIYSLIVFFELLLFLNLKESSPGTPATTQQAVIT